jgi:hypothetical protein
MASGVSTGPLAWDEIGGFFPIGYAKGQNDKP